MNDRPKSSSALRLAADSVPASATPIMPVLEAGDHRDQRLGLGHVAFEAWISSGKSSRATSNPTVI